MPCPNCTSHRPAWKEISYCVPRTLDGTEGPRQFLTSIDKIEEQTGLDFFTEMENDQEARLEANVAPDMW